jgi:uncharacterized protein (DUF952 family)
MTIQSIFHITQRQQWEAAQRQSIYRCDSLDTEGFIHCSTLAQVVRVANSFYRGQSGLMLLEIASDRLRSKLQYDVIETGEAFPHLYGPLNIDAVIQVLDFAPQADGSFALPEELTRQT